MKTLTLSILLVLSFPATLPALDTARIEELTGLKGTPAPEEGVFKLTLPRGDLGITVDGWKMPAFMGLTSWAAFMEGKKEEATVMGNLVLLQDEVNPVMSAVLGSGLSVTALHNHFFHADPKAYFMHIEGEGTSEKLASGVRATFSSITGVAARPPTWPLN